VPDDMTQTAIGTLHAGLDVGSLSCDAVVINDTGDVLASAIVLTGARSREAGREALRLALAHAGIDREQLASLVSTGYGRDRVEGRSHANTEIACHARGAAHLLPGVRTVLDVGGQDCKAISVGPEGRVLDFAMNDKCAAGTGRFFEVMARALEMDVDELGEISLGAQRKLSLSSICTVFAESEVIGLIARGESPAEIAWALCDSAAQRVVGLANRVGVTETVMVTGGVAKNIGFVAALQAALGSGVTVPAEPQIVGALGAALIGADRLRRGAAS